MFYQHTKGVSQIIKLGVTAYASNLKIIIYCGIGKKFDAVGKITSIF
jgi:hypothetical protein